MNDKKNNIEDLLEGVTFDDAPDIRHENLLEQRLLLNFKTAGAPHRSKRRSILNKQLTKFAAAAVILIGVVVGFELFKGTGSVSWAKVRQRVAAVPFVLPEACGSRAEEKDEG